MSESPFLFLNVDNTGKVPRNKNVRTAIQKHVMRDIGAARRGKPRKRPQLRLEPDQIDALGDHELLQLEETGSDRSSLVIKVPPLVSGGTRTDPFAQYPVFMNSDTLFLIDYIYTTPKPHLRPLRDTWLPLAFSDPAFFYEILSHIALDVASARLPSTASDVEYDYQASTISLALHSLALRSINQRLTDPMKGLSDGVIGTILAFACFSHSSKNWESYAMHMDGLLAIIKAKGGINEINHNQILRLLLLGIDVSASCFSGTPRRFPTPAPLLQSLRTHSQETPWWLPLQESSSTRQTNVWTIVFPLDDNLADIFKELSTTIMIIKQESEKRLLWQDKQFAKDYVESLTYRLLESSVEVGEVHDGNFVAECCRLGALILVSKIRQRFGTPNSKLIFTGLEAAKLVNILEMYAGHWIKFQPMLLWVAFLGALEVEGPEREWLCSLVRETAHQLMIGEWEDILVNVSNLLWVGQVLDAECQKLRPLIENDANMISHGKAVDSVSLGFYKEAEGAYTYLDT